MYELSRLTINKEHDELFQSNKIYNKFEKTEKKIEKIENKSNKILLKDNVKKENIYKKRKFNPRLPPPNMHHNNVQKH